MNKRTIHTLLVLRVYAQFFSYGHCIEHLVCVDDKFTLEAYVEKLGMGLELMTGRWRVVLAMGSPTRLCHRAGLGV